MRWSERIPLLVVGLAACGRQPRTDEPERRRGHAVLLDAGVTTSASPPDAYVQDDEVERKLHLFGGEDGYGIEAAMSWLVAHPERARPALLAALERDRDGLDLKYELVTLGRIGHPDDVPLLKRWLMRSSGKVWAFESAKALQLHPSPDAEAALLDCLSYPEIDLVENCTWVLGERGAESARQLLEAELAHPERSVRLLAIGAIVKLGAARSRTAIEARQRVETDKLVLDRLTEAFRP